MSEITVPFNKIDYVNYSTEIYDECSYNRVGVDLDCGNSFRATISFFWKTDETVPVELIEIIKNNGITINGENEAEPI